MSIETAKPIRLGGVLYDSETPARNALRQFAKILQNRGWHVCGLSQEIARDEFDEKIGLDAVDLRTGKHLPLARPSKEDRESGTCGFDLGWLSDTTQVLRDALESQADLVVVEKFGEREQEGNGLADDILNCAVTGLPTLVAVPTNAFETWNTFSGHMGDLLPHNLDTLWRWWPKWNLYKDLILGIEECDILDIVIGENALLVQTEKGCGVCANSGNLEQDFKTDSMSLTSLSELIFKNPDTFEHKLATAAILAAYNNFDLQGPDKSGLDTFANTNDHVLVAGNFPNSKNYSNQFDKVDPSQMLHCLSEHAFDGLILPAQSFSDMSLPNILEKKGNARTVIVGPETPLSTRLFEYGVDVLSGRVIEDVNKAKEIVKAGGAPKDLKPASRYVTLER